MATTSPRKYKTITVTGPVSVDRVNKMLDSDIQSYNMRIILIMGPTGAGKSTFIETLGLRNAKKISSNKLEGFTQTVSTYRMNNVVSGDGNTIYLVDSPGFADTNISEMAIVSMLRKWLSDHGGMIFHRILYLTPITQVRLPGSQRQVIKTFQALTGVKTARQITIVTTMWDAIWGERAIAKAEGIRKQFESDVWKDFIEQGAQILTFHNTQDSTLSVLDEALSQFSEEYFHVENQEGVEVQQTPFAANLYTDLQDRIQSLQLVIPSIQSELDHAMAEDDQELQSALRPRLREAMKHLLKFQGELQEYGPPPPGLYLRSPVQKTRSSRSASEVLRPMLPLLSSPPRSGLYPHNPVYNTRSSRSASEVSRPPPLSLSPLRRDLPVVSIPAADIPVSIPMADTPPPNRTYIRPTAIVQNGLPNTHATVVAPSIVAEKPIHPQPGWPVYALNFITGCARCCGKGVEANHEA